MFRLLPHWLRGSLSFGTIIVSTLTLVPLVILFAFVKLLVPFTSVRTLCTRILIAIATLWVGINNLLLQTLGGIDWDVEGVNDLNPNDWYLVTANHQSWADILVVQRVLYRRIPMLKFFLKQQLIWVPVIGVAWWALDFPFMKRYSAEEIARNPALKGKDLETTRQACEKFKYTPVTVFNFPEGTRFTLEKHDRQQSPYRHLLRPKAGGTAFVLGAMGDKLHTLLNVTIHYPGDQHGFWALLSGRVRRVIVRVEKVSIPDEFLNRDYLQDEEFRLSFQQWITELWQRKDALLDTLEQQHAETG